MFHVTSKTGLSLRGVQWNSELMITGVWAHVCACLDQRDVLVPSRVLVLFVFKSNGDSVFICRCVFQSRGLLIQVPEIVRLWSRISFGNSHVKGQRGGWLQFKPSDPAELLLHCFKWDCIVESYPHLCLTIASPPGAGYWYKGGWNAVCGRWEMEFAMQRCSCWTCSGSWLLFHQITIPDLPVVYEKHSHKITCQHR